MSVSAHQSLRQCPSLGLFAASRDCRCTSILVLSRPRYPNAARGNPARDRLTTLHFLNRYLDLSNLALCLFSYYTKQMYVYSKTMEPNIWLLVDYRLWSAKSWSPPFQARPFPQASRPIATGIAMQVRFHVSVGMHVL